MRTNSTLQCQELAWLLRLDEAIETVVCRRSHTDICQRSDPWCWGTACLTIFRAVPCASCMRTRVSQAHTSSQGAWDARPVPVE
eukprot:934956-Amphidinium_carterae.2